MNNGTYPSLTRICNPYAKNLSKRCQEASLPEPEFKEINGGVEVTVFISKVSGNGLVDGLVDGLVESQRRIVEMIQNNPKISKKSMAEQIGISQTAIDKHIKTLKEKQLLIRIGSDRTGVWQLNDKKK
jgi:ATP-dependent DNA helicase RecG